MVAVGEPGDIDVNGNLRGPARRECIETKKNE
jgi:hypothetical protein